MAAISFPPNDTPSTARTLYIFNPWTDPSGNQWLWSAAKERWSPISETVENAVTDNNTNAVSSNAVFDALALKAPLSGATFTGPITATAITGTTGTFSGNISPTVNNTQSFGSPGLNWNTIWTRNVRSDSGTLILNDGNGAITITNGILALGNRKLTALRGLEFQVDNAYDIGATSTTLRPRDLFLARNAGIGGNLTATGTVTAGGTNTWTGSTFSGTQAFSGDVSVTDATASTTTTTGALKVAGGLGVVGAVTAGSMVTATRGTVGVGTVYTNLPLTAHVFGTSTDFLSRFVVGDSITFTTTGGPETRMITSIGSDTSMTTVPFSGASASGAESYTHTTASAVMNPSGAITGTTGTFSGTIKSTSGDIEFSAGYGFKPTLGYPYLCPTSTGWEIWTSSSKAAYSNLKLANLTASGTLLVTGDSTLKSWIVGTDITATVGGASIQVSSGGNIRFGGNGARLQAETSGMKITASDNITLNDLSIRNLTASGTVTAAGNAILPTSTTPASASATGVAGTVCRDADYIYVCTATNTWKRAALSTW